MTLNVGAYPTVGIANAMIESIQHLLILCCYGGAPFIDYSNLNSLNNIPETNLLDPTDWIAIDSEGSWLNSSIHPEFLKAYPNLINLIPNNTQIMLDQCDLYNLTFGSLADQKLYNQAHAILSCRCPKNRFGRACELDEEIDLLTLMTTQQLDPIMNPSADPVLNLSNSQSLQLEGNSNSFAMYMVLFLIFMLVMAAIFMMLRGCLCDCFGGFKSPFNGTNEYDRPIDPTALNRCLEAVKTYEQNEKNKYHQESRRPLISSVSENCPSYPNSHGGASVYPIQISVPNPTAPPIDVMPNFTERSRSPPPAYKSLNGSVEFLPTSNAVPKLNNTKL